MNIDISADTPERWGGELTDDKLRLVTSGLLIGSAQLGVRIASELLSARSCMRALTASLDASLLREQEARTAAASSASPHPL